jgi:hypothetical protein
MFSGTVGCGASDSAASVDEAKRISAQAKAPRGGRCINLLLKPDGEKS